MTLNSNHYLARIYKTDELWFFPSLVPIAVDNIQLDAEAIVYKKKSNSRVLNKKKKLSVSELKAMLNKSKKIWVLNFYLCWTLAAQKLELKLLKMKG